MNIAVTSNGPTKDATCDMHFGRAPYFVIIDSDSGEGIKDYNNEQNVEAVQGSGIESAKVMADLDVKVVLTGHVGPKALEVLKIGGISVYKVEATSVKEAFKKYEENDVKAIHEADVKCHWA